jgi:FkbM family methyltransferase
VDANGWAGLAETIRTKTAIVQLVAQTTEGMFLFDARDLGVGWTLAQGGYEVLETQIFKHLVRPGDLVIDAGANLGWYATIAGRLVGPDGMVLAFEPDAANLNFLRVNLTGNGVADRVRVFPVALYERDGEIAFDTSADNFGDHRIAAAGDGAGARPRTMVAARTLDAVLAESGLAQRPIGVFKVDTQGAEVAIFRGAGAALRRTQHLVAEFWPHGLRCAGYDAAEYAAIVGANFSRFARLGSNDIQSRPIAEFPADIASPTDVSGPQGFTNYLFLK